MKNLGKVNAFGANDKIWMMQCSVECILSGEAYLKLFLREEF